MRNHKAPLERYDVVVDEDALVALSEHEQTFQAELVHDVSHAFRCARDFVPGHLCFVSHLIEQVDIRLAVVREIQLLQFAYDFETERGVPGCRGLEGGARCAR